MRMGPIRRHQTGCTSVNYQAGMTRRPCCRDSGWSLVCDTYVGKLALLRVTVTVSQAEPRSHPQKPDSLRREGASAGPLCAKQSLSQSQADAIPIKTIAV